MGMGNRLIEPHDRMEQTGCELSEALSRLNWAETEIRRKETIQRVTSLPANQATQIDETLPF